MWRWTLGKFLIAVGPMYIIGLVGGLLVGGFLDVSLDDVVAAVGIGGYIATLALGGYVVRMALRKKYKGFRLALVPS